MPAKEMVALGPRDREAKPSLAGQPTCPSGSQTHDPARYETPGSALLEQGRQAMRSQKAARLKLPRYESTKIPLEMQMDR